MSRIVDATVLSSPAWRPDDFDLAAWWAESATAFDRAIRPLATRLRLSPDAARQLRRAVPGDATADALAAGRTGEGGWIEVDLPLESIEVGLSQLAALRGVEVVDPPELRRALATLGESHATLNA